MMIRLFAIYGLAQPHIANSHILLTIVATSLLCACMPMQSPDNSSLTDYRNNPKYSRLLNLATAFGLNDDNSMHDIVANKMQVEGAGSYKPSTAKETFTLASNAGALASGILSSEVASMNVVSFFMPKPQAR